jgi:hypothetical protein
LHVFNHHHHHHSERKKKESLELCCYIQKLAALEVVVVRKGRKQRVVGAHGKQREGRRMGRICGGWEVLDGGVGLGTDGRTGGALGTGKVYGHVGDSCDRAVMPRFDKITCLIGMKAWWRFEL